MQGTVNIRVRYAETDQMKFAHHSAYIVWFEMARIELLREMGISYAQMEKEGILLPVLEVKATFFKPAFFDEQLHVVARFAALKKARLHIDYQVFREQNLICEGYSKHAFMNNQGRPIRPPQIFVETLKR